MFKTIDSTYGTEKLVSRSRAKVIDNIDPLSRGRIRVNSPILGETVWIPYLTSPGMFSVPDIDDIVYVEADGGYETHPVAWGNFTKGADASPDIPTEFQKFNPTNRGFYTPNGILVELDDTVLTAGIRITTAAGIKLNLDDVTDTVTLETVSGNSLTIEPTEISFVDSFGNSITTDAQGVTIEDVTGNTITTSPTGIQVKTTLGSELNLATGKVALGTNAGELFLQLVTLLEAFTTAAPTFVSTAVGPGVMNPALATAIVNATTILTAMQGTL